MTANGTLVADYAYDGNGNRTHEREDLGGGAITAYDAQDRLTSYAGTAYTYSEAGDLETKTDAGGTTSYAYDALGNLRSVLFPDGKQLEYVIDGQSRRVGKKGCPAPCGPPASPVLQQGFLYADPLRIVAELDGSNNVVSRFVYATRPNVPDFLVKGGVTYRIPSDQIGSVRLVVDASTGAIAQRIDYDAWGNVTTDTNPGFQPFGFAGGLHDPDTGLVRFGARDYDPAVGRWTTKDPIRFDGGDANLYGYVFEDPVNLNDPDGELAPLAFGLIGGVVGGFNNAVLIGFSGNENIGTAFLTGFVGGFAGGVTAGLLLSPTAGGAVAAGLTEALNQRYGLSCGSARDVIRAATVGAAAGGTLGRLGGELVSTAASDAEEAAALALSRLTFSQLAGGLSN